MADEGRRNVIKFMSFRLSIGKKMLGGGRGETIIICVKPQKLNWSFSNNFFQRQKNAPVVEAQPNEGHELYLASKGGKKILHRAGDSNPRGTLPPSFPGGHSNH